jgi:thioredoxin 1
MRAHKNNVGFRSVGGADFEWEISQSSRPVLAVFGAPWSRPCQIIDPVLADVDAACAGSAKIVRVNADDNPHLSLCYSVDSLPTLLCFVDGLLREKLVGPATKEAILSLLHRHGNAICGSTPAAKGSSRLRRGAPRVGHPTQALCWNGGGAGRKHPAPCKIQHQQPKRASRFCVTRSSVT